MWDAETEPTPNRDLAGHWIEGFLVGIATIISRGIKNGKGIHVHASYTGVMDHEPPLFGEGQKFPCAYFLEIARKM